MRTTIELNDELRAKLLEAAARRGDKGFSALIQEALDRYFEGSAERDERVARALAAIGSLDEPQAARLEEDVRSLRRSWR